MITTQEIINNPACISLDPSTVEQQRLAVSLDTKVFYSLVDPCEEIQQYAVTMDMFAISSIKNPSYNIQYTSVSKWPWSIQYIANPHYDIQKLAISQDGYIIELMDNSTEELQLIAVKVSPACHIRNISERAASLQEVLLIDMVRKNPNLISDLPLYEKVQHAACSTLPSAYAGIKDPYLAVKLAYG